MKLAAKIIALVIALMLIAAIYFYATINSHQTSGELKLSILDAPVTVRRDALAIPYIEAESLPDALRAQGFLTGQDRLYQAQLYRYIALGRLAEVFGERGLKSDQLIRLMGINQLAEKQAAALDQQARDYFTHYIEGLNAYISEQQHEHPLSVKMLGFKAETWSLQDIIAVQLFQTWSNGGNWRMDIISQQLIDAFGAERAQQLAAVSINPDDDSMAVAQLSDEKPKPGKTKLKLAIETELAAVLPKGLSSGSNAWATGSRKSTSGKPIFSNNPHLPNIAMPGFWHPMGLFTPELTAVGVAAPGSPGIGVGRTKDIAYGATVGGSDGADLYIEDLDLAKIDHYLQGGISKSLHIREEIILVKDKQQATGFRQQHLRIRSTPRGPLISDIGIAVIEGYAVSIRWAVAGTLTPSTAGDRLLRAKNLAEAREAIKMSPVALSHIVVDKDGGIGRISGGRVPLRIQGDGLKPIRVSDLAEHDYDNWRGLIPDQEMPIELNPEKDWVGTANHRIVPGNYPHEFSKIFAVSWRYRRIKEFMESKKQVSVEDHWDLINDIKNPMAERIAGLFISALRSKPEHAHLADILDRWDYRDSSEQIAPTLFQLLSKHTMRLTFQDDIPEQMWEDYFDAVYYWQERFVLILDQPDNVWFDIASTNQIETRDQILQLAIDASLQELKATLGSDYREWQWGKLHTITFNSPILPGETAARWLGSGTHPVDGSGETLNRGLFKMSKQYRSEIIDSMRLVADMADNEKILLVIPGGTSGRHFDASLANQTDDWLQGKANVVWFDLDKVKENAVTEIRLLP